MRQVLLVTSLLLVVGFGGFTMHGQTIAVCSEDQGAADAHVRELKDIQRILDVKKNSAVWRDAMRELGWGERKRYVIADLAVFAFKMGVPLPKDFKSRSLDQKLEIQRGVAAVIKQKQDTAAATTREALEGSIALKLDDIEQLNQKKRDGRCETNAAFADVSGAWYGSNNIQYVFRQTGKNFSWNLQRFSENGNGVIDGQTIRVSWSGNNGSGSATGQITEIKYGRATRIVWSNGVVFSRQ